MNLMDGAYAEHIDEFFIIDCRFGFEYDGGHIEGAHNISALDVLQKVFFPPRPGRCLIVFHCEFSSHRAPRMFVSIHGFLRLLFC